MNPSVRNEEAPIRVTITEDVQGGVRLEEHQAPPALPPIPAYGDYVRVLEGRSTGTVCMPLASSGEIPSPDPEQIQALWNQVLAESSRLTSCQTAEQANRSQEEKTKKLERLLLTALHSGDIDSAMLLLAGLESREADRISAGLMQRMLQLQDQRKKLTGQMAPTGDQSKDAQNSQSVSAQMADIGTEISLLQTFLQDVQSHKNETQQMASNYLKSQHDTAMGIVRNMA
jgi:hypothetical protein